MSFSIDLADIRFGCGLSPLIPSPPSVDAMLAGVAGPDHIATRFPIQNFEDLARVGAEADTLNRTKRKTTDPDKVKALKEQVRALNLTARNALKDWAGQSLLRWARTETGFRERLIAFWADHLTAVGKTALFRYANPAYVESAIRPHIAGHFSDLLIAGATHPVMLDYLDQLRSVGPNSAVIGTNRLLRGLNENLAREVLELHTLGVGGPYDQIDVREFAELLTGLSFKPGTGPRYVPKWAEPGAETLLGKTYAAAPSLETIHEALRDLSVHPATAAHLARKLAVHFVSDTPDPALIAHVEARWAATGGHLPSVYAALLEHPAAWDPAPTNVKPPFDFMGSALRALGAAPDAFDAIGYPRFRRLVFQPLALMGQPWQAPGGPDGWPEADAAWLTPQGLSGRLRWAMAVPQIVTPDLPDPRSFVYTALGPRVSEATRLTSRAAETRADGIGIILCSPAFQRR